MSTLSYVTGNPNNLTAGGTASMNDIQGPFTDIRTWANGNVDVVNLTLATQQTLGMTNGSQVGRGKCIIATSESRSNVAYGTLTTPDQVQTVVLPTDGLLAIAYQATVQESVIGASRVAIFIGATQLKMANQAGAPGTQATGILTGGANTDRSVATFPGGLMVTENSNSGDVTTGQIVGTTSSSAVQTRVEMAGGGVTLAAGFGGGPCYVFAAAGTYTISVQYKASSGSVTASNRKLWVWTLGF